MKRLKFAEFEAFADAVQGASMRMRMSVLETPMWSLQHASVGTLQIQQGHEGGGNIAEGITASDCWTIFHQVSPARPGLANGEILTEDQVFAIPPKGAFCLACLATHDWTAITIPDSDLFPVLSQHEFASSAKPILLKPARTATRRFNSLLQRFLAAAKSKPSLIHSTTAVQSFRRELLGVVRGLFSSGHQFSSPKFMRWHRQAELATELAQAHPNPSPNVAELAQLNGVSERTLRRAFQGCYGLSPLEYLRIHRLHQARKLLRTSCPDTTTVTQVAFDGGFWDLGRFAGSYRQLFGELPSETLRKPARSKDMSKSGVEVIG
jgi:AraC-like DNA-binding protein